MPDLLTYLSQALSAAREYLAVCAPNPAVGAVLVKGGEVLAVGAHTGPGHPHAEVEALKDIDTDLSDATLYVTLEPCCHHGRTPPCVDLIIQKGIGHVVFSELDPNPEVSGKGQAALQQAGIRCEQVDHSDIHAFYAAYRHWWRTGRPYVTVKMAMSRNGKIAHTDGSPASISGEACFAFTHTERYHQNAILTTITTVLHDDPALNARLDTQTIAKPVYVLDANARLPLNAQLFHTAKQLTVFHGISADQNRITALKEKGVRCVQVQESDGRLDLTQALKHIAADGHHTLWVEVGGQCLQSFIVAGYLNRLLLYIAPEALEVDAVPALPGFLPGDGHDVIVSWGMLGNDAILSLTSLFRV